MSIEIIAKEGRTIAALSGDIDLAHSPEVRKKLLECVNAGKPLVVDMSQVGYIDSSGIASLVESLQVARRKAQPFALAGIAPPVMRVLQLARLDRVFTIYPTVEEAFGMD